MDNTGFARLIKDEKLLLVDFFAEWCGPCKIMGPILSEVKKAVGDKVKIVKVDIDRNAAAAQSFHVQSVPTLILFKNGRQVWRQPGVVQAAQLKNILEQHA